MVVNVFVAKATITTQVAATTMAVKVFATTTTTTTKLKITGLSMIIKRVQCERRAIILVRQEQK